ncbi:hypothetical protein BRD19_08685 [Halobacteriales archaeon SW_7_65_23]|nr:MAG: hypothetical protein BRD19_08685 [Halobacteriales archaeon SW_7_65_23]
MPERTVWAIALLTLVVGAVLGAGLATSVLDDGSDEQTPNDPTATGPSADRLDPALLLANESSVEQFGTAEAFKQYVRAGQQQDGRIRVREGRLQGGVENEAMEDGGNGNGDGARRGGDDGGDAMESADSAEFTGGSGSEEPERVGETNVQVEGFDEPDVVKTDGANFYYSPVAGGHHPRPVIEDDDHRRSEEPDPSTHVIDLSEPADPAAIANVDASGRMLQTGDTLVVFEQRESRIVGYDVSDPANPVESWSQPLEDRLVTAREAGGQVYVVTETSLGYSTPCPIEPLGEDHAVDCGDVYRPDVQTSAEATYTAFSIDAASGTVEDSVSFVGTGDDTVVYMSEGSLYLTYTTGISEADLLASWVTDTDAFPQHVKDRVAEINSYDISERSKQREISQAIEQWLRSLSEEERRELNEDLRGPDPGEPLNQFALDKYEGTLRIATTIPRAGDAKSTNQLHVLDSETLTQEDKVTGMGEDQRIYSVRYVGDTAYLVTFRQVDPFYVVDFEEPRDPELLGKLKLPGFSNYLHPVDNQTVLGIGKEDREVKAALFDVSDPTTPEVGDDLQLDEHFSAIDESHHAFMMDREHGVFFLPAENTGLVVDYTGGELEVVKEVRADAPVSRARYVDDYLYIFAGNEIIVLDQTDWTRETTLSVGE